MQDMQGLFEEMIVHQQKVMLKLAKSIVPQVIMDDLLQPNDFKELENHPLFRYEEGVLAGILSAKAAFNTINKK